MTEPVGALVVVPPRRRPNFLQRGNRLMVSAVLWVPGLVLEGIGRFLDAIEDGSLVNGMYLFLFGPDEE